MSFEPTRPTSPVVSRSNQDLSLSVELTERRPWSEPSLKDFGRVTLVTQNAGLNAGDGVTNLT